MYSGIQHWTQVYKFFFLYHQSICKRNLVHTANKSEKVCKNTSWNILCVHCLYYVRFTTYLHHTHKTNSRRSTILKSQVVNYKNRKSKHYSWFKRFCWFKSVYTNTVMLHRGTSLLQLVTITSWFIHFVNGFSSAFCPLRLLHFLTVFGRLEKNVNSVP